MILGQINENISTKHSATVTKIVFSARKEWHKVERQLLIAWNIFCEHLKPKEICMKSKLSIKQPMA